ncbi:hypothetical protein [Streptomyces sp. AJS327]|uniref:hypothetical protein n=1 Tax=Streptomyces sp. AJS327 TaxID=2545265 RepID=UPI0027E4F4F6|nr:hypothetical protein [Streptomyces sp. AJS327]
MSDFTGAEVRVGDTIVWAARLANLTRMTEGEVVDVSTELVKGRVLPVIKARPTGRYSGFIARTSGAIATIRSEHWVVTVPVEMKEKAGVAA